MSAYDGCKNGVRVEEAITIAQMLQDAGCDAIEVSCGGGDGFSSVRVSEIPMEAALKLVPWYRSMHALKKRLLALMAPLAFKKHRPLHNYNVEAAKRIRELVEIPVIVVGGIRRIEDIREIIGKNEADYVSMSRPFIIEPNIVTKFLNGKQDASRCIDCGYCLLGVAGNWKVSDAALSRMRGLLGTKKATPERLIAAFAACTIGGEAFADAVLARAVETGYIELMDGIVWGGDPKSAVMWRLRDPLTFLPHGCVGRTRVQ